MEFRTWRASRKLSILSGILPVASGPVRTGTEGGSDLDHGQACSTRLIDSRFSRSRTRELTVSGKDEVIDDAETDQMAEFLSRCVKEILGRQDPGSFLQWLETSGPSLLPGPFAAAPDQQMRRALAAALGSTIWNATPLPENGYRPRPLPRPERNEPCPRG